MQCSVKAEYKLSRRTKGVDMTGNFFAGFVAERESLILTCVELRSDGGGLATYPPGELE